MSLKRWTKTSLSRLMAKIVQPKGKRVVVLCYHSIHPSKPFASATPERFAEHLEWLKAHCHLIPLAEALSVARSGDGNRPSVAITFDDGYSDNYQYAFPLLQEHGVPATFFATVGLVERDPAVLERFQTLRKAPLEDVQPLTWEQIREMRRAGMAIGSHTWSHPNLARLRPSEARQELLRAKEVLEERLGEAVPLLAYPFGKPRRHFTPGTMELAAEIGYEMAAAVLFRGIKPGDSPLALPRFFVTQDRVETLGKKVNGAWDWLGLWQERAPLWLARLISPEDFQV